VSVVQQPIQNGVGKRWFLDTLDSEEFSPEDWVEMFFVAGYTGGVDEGIRERKCTA